MIYRSVGSCVADYIGKTNRNSEIRLNEHITGKDKSSDCVRHLKDHFDHEFRWFILSYSFKSYLKRTILEAHYIKTCPASLNNQIDSNALNLFRNDLT